MLVLDIDRTTAERLTLADTFHTRTLDQIEERLPDNFHGEIVLLKSMAKISRYTERGTVRYVIKGYAYDGRDITQAFAEAGLATPVRPDTPKASIREAISWPS